MGPSWDPKLNKHYDEGVRQTHVIFYNLRAARMGNLAQGHVCHFQKKGTVSGKAQRHKVLLYLVVGGPLGLGERACVHSFTP